MAVVSLTVRQQNIRGYHAPQRAELAAGTVPFKQRDGSRYGEVPIINSSPAMFACASDKRQVRNLMITVEIAFCTSSRHFFVVAGS